MAVEMAIAALTFSEKIHYVINGNGRDPDVYRINTFSTLELRDKILNYNIQGGGIRDEQ